MTLSCSGVIASYNQEQYIADAVASLVDQVDELIVVDDHSTDGTYEILLELSSRCANLKVIRDENKLGVSRALSLGFQMAKSEVILIQGGDDVSLPNRREIQAKSLEINETSLTYSSPIIINESGLELDASVAPEFKTDVSSDRHLEQLFYFGNYICAPSVGIRRKDFLKWGGFQPNLDALQDYALWLRAADAGKFFVSASPVVGYRKHGRNLSRSDFSNQISHRRHRAELPFLLNSFLNAASEVCLERLLKANSNMNEFQNRQLAIVAIKLGHPDRLLRLEGIRDLFEFSISGVFDSRELMDFNAQINQALGHTDPDNVVSLIQAISSLKNLDANLQRIWESGGA